MQYLNNEKYTKSSKNRIILTSDLPKTISTTDYYYTALYLDWY